jgi:hypothetical protein
MSVGGQCSNWRIVPLGAASYGEYQSVRMASKMHFRWTGDNLVDTRIAHRAIVTIQFISCVATILVMGLILTMVGASIYGILIPH